MTVAKKTVHKDLLDSLLADYRKLIGEKGHQSCWFTFTLIGRRS